jgi:hypothetical protein
MIIGYKQVCGRNRRVSRDFKSTMINYYVIELKAGYRIINAEDAGKKLRTDFAIPTGKIWRIEKTRRGRSLRKVDWAMTELSNGGFVDIRTGGLQYIRDVRAYPDSFENSVIQCAHGIHFFLHRKDAMHY